MSSQPSSSSPSSSSSSPSTPTSGGAQSTSSSSPKANQATSTVPQSSTTSSSASSSSSEVGNSSSPSPDEVPSPTSPTWTTQDVVTSCEFTWTIKDYTQKRESGCKKAEYSSTSSDVYGNRWRLIIYVNGNGKSSNNHLSLFLQVADCDNLPFGWKKNVSYVLTLEHPKDEEKSFAKRNPDKTFKLCPKAIDWGWSQFITSDRIQQDSFISGDTLTVRAVVTVKSSSVQISAEDSELYLKHAVEDGSYENVKYCLGQGASVNCQFKDDLYTPLHTACSSLKPGSVDVLNLLLSRNADGNAVNKWLETPLLIAANNGHEEGVKALLKSGADPSKCSEAGWSALTFAAHKGYERIVDILVLSSAPVNCRVSEDNSTPLHKACAGNKRGHLESCKLLLEAGADVHALNKWKETPLLTAANNGQTQAVKSLLEHNADSCLCTDTGWSPLSIAAYKGHDEVVKFLLREGAPTEEEDPTLSALLQAATKGLPDTVMILLRHGANHNVTTKKGDTALSILVEQNLIDAAVKMVTKYKASIPRCSRDRKKVQRARLLINLRIKQQQRDGLLDSDLESSDGSEDDGDRDFNDDDSAAVPESQEEDGSKGKKKKKKKKKNSANAAEAAEAAAQALLLELEDEETKAKETEVKNSKKAAKKKKKNNKKKDKEKEERRKMEEREKEEEEKKKREREREVERKKIEREKEEEARKLKEIEEKEKIMADKIKKREERERKEREERENTKSEEDERREIDAKKNPHDRNTEAQQQTHKTQTPQTPEAAASNAVAAVKGPERGWETKPVPKSAPVAPAPAAPLQPNKSNPVTTAPPKPPYHQQAPNFPSSSSSNSSTSKSPLSLSPNADKVLAAPDPSHLLNPTPQQPNHPPSFAPPTNRPAAAAFSPTTIPEFPAVCVFRAMKVRALITEATKIGISAPVARECLHRWAIRASHTTTQHLDPIIPSWTDSKILVSFLQRQLITANLQYESNINPELLKEAGRALAKVSLAFANEIKEFTARCASQVPADWSDRSLGFTTGALLKEGVSHTVIDWSGQARLEVPDTLLRSLTARYVGPQTHFFAAVFAAIQRYNTFGGIVETNGGDLRFPPTALQYLCEEKHVIADCYSDPLSAHPSSLFCGLFPDVDKVFGGLAPFGKEGGGGENRLTKQGGAVCCIPPLEHTLAANYMRKVLERIYDAKNKHALSFFIVLPTQCFRKTGNQQLTRDDLKTLDTRLVDKNGGGGKSGLVRRVFVLPPNGHAFRLPMMNNKISVPTTSSLFVLIQNDAGFKEHKVSDQDVSALFGKMTPMEASRPMVQPKTKRQQVAPFATQQQPPGFGQPQRQQEEVTQPVPQAASFAPQQPVYQPQQHQPSLYGSAPTAPTSQDSMLDFGVRFNPSIGSSSNSSDGLGIGWGSGGGSGPSKLGRTFALVDDDEGDIPLGSAPWEVESTLGNLGLTGGLGGLGNNDPILNIFKPNNDQQAEEIDIESIATAPMGLSGSHQQPQGQGGNNNWNGSRLFK